MAVSESVGTKDVGHPVQGGSNLRLFTRDLIMVTISVISWSPDMSPDDVAHARGHRSLVITSLGGSHARKGLMQSRVE